MIHHNIIIILRQYEFRMKFVRLKNIMIRHAIFNKRV